MDHRKDAEVRKSIADYYRLTRARERAERDAVAGGTLSISFDQAHEVANLMCSQGNVIFCIAKIPYAELASYGLKIRLEERNES